MAKKKKKKKLASVKITKDESDRNIGNCGEQADIYMSDQSLYVPFILRINKWFRSNLKNVHRHFSTFDKDNNNSLTFQEFASGMMDMQAPCTTVELLVLARYLDKDGDRSINYTEFSCGVTLTPTVQENQRISARGGYMKCSQCNINRWCPNSAPAQIRYITINFQWKLFTTKTKSHESFFSSTVHSHSTIQLLIQLVNEQYGESLGEISLYNPTSLAATKTALAVPSALNTGAFGILTAISFNKSSNIHLLSTKRSTNVGVEKRSEILCGPPSKTVLTQINPVSSTALSPPDAPPLDPCQTLEEHGFAGGTFESPQSVTLIYDFETSGNTLCHLLNCDHYFLREKK